ncbi:MAG: hypothetical protein CBC71_05770 [Rhodobacteraceae bacterium TMED111]|nr:MAG: hypothetical protein CBC71_05770 [Rhodobacteraceae bacterium TMED111]
MNPDGVRIVVNWDNMVTSSSVFVPCVDAQEAIRQIKNIVKTKGWDVETHVRVENNKLGVRIWRIL